MKRMLDRLIALHRGQDAQGMVFGAISLFMLAACIGLVHNSGTVTSRRIQAQSAADAGAYAGALTTANILSDVAWMNDGMAYVYYNLMRYAVDVTVLRTLAEMKEHNMWGGAPYVSPPGSAYGGGDPVGDYDRAYKRAEEMIPKGEKYLDILSRMEHSLAVCGKYLVRKAVVNTALGNCDVDETGASDPADRAGKISAAAIFHNDASDSVFFHPNVGDIDLLVEYSEDGQPLWKVTYNGAPYLEIWKHGPNHWEIVRPGVQSVDILRIDQNNWQIKSGDQVTQICRNPKDGSLEVTTSGSVYAHLLAIPVGDNMWAITGQVGGIDVAFRPLGGGGYTLTVNGATAGIRTNNGTMQQLVDDKWVDIPGQGSITVGGETIPISFSNHIDLNPPHNVPSLDYPGTLNLGPISFTIPDHIRFAGTDVTLGENYVSVSAQVGLVTMVIDGRNERCVLLNGRSTCGSGEKRGYRIQGVYGHDRIETIEPGRKWLYKWRAIEALLKRGDIARLGWHAVEDAEAATGIDNTWTSWFDISTGNRKNQTAYHQTAPCWNDKDCADGTCADGFTSSAISGHRDLCPTCNPNYPYIDYDQRFETTADGQFILDKDGDGKSDVRKYGLNAVFFRHHHNSEKDRPYQEVKVAENARPLYATAAVFAHPLVVAVWYQNDTPLFGTRFGGDSDAGDAPLFRNPDWGYCAVACSRVGVLTKEEEPNYAFTFDGNADLDYHFDFDEGEFLRRVATRDEWLASWHNHYEPVWTAKLWSTYEATRSVDMEIALEQEELDKWKEVSRNFIWRMLAEQTRWFDPNGGDQLSGVMDPRTVEEARDAYNRIRNPRTGDRFRIGIQTDEQHLKDALQH